jgi:hypothetical protein
MVQFEPYLLQNARWPSAGRHILAQFDAESVVVYQAFRPAIAEEAAVPSTFSADAWPSAQAWQDAVRRSDVRLQWDPDHGPTGNPVARRAIQLGLRGATLTEFAGPALLQVEDLTHFVARERDHAVPPYELLQTPSESVFQPQDPATAAALGLDAWPA